MQYKYCENICNHFAHQYPLMHPSVNMFEGECDSNSVTIKLAMVTINTSENIQIRTPISNNLRKSIFSCRRAIMVTVLHPKTIL